MAAVGASPEGSSRKSRRLEAAAVTSVEDGQRTSDCRIERLPNELLTQILSELDQTSLSRCAQLSRRWQRLATQPRLWRRICIGCRNFGINLHLTRRLSEWLSGSLLELRADRLTGAELAPLLSNSPNLRRLSAIIGRDSYPAEAENLLATLGRCCHSLQSLQLRGGIKDVLTANSLRQLQTGCLRLSELEIGSSDSLEVYSVTYLRLLPVLQVAVLAGRLTSLRLPNNFPNGEFLAALQECPSLSTLTIGPLRKSELRQLLSRLPHLSELELFGNKFTDGMAAELANGCGRRLRALQLHWITELTGSGLAAMLHRCRGLRQLRLSLLDELDPTGYELLVHSLPPGLEVLQLYGVVWIQIDRPVFELKLPSSLRHLELRGDSEFSSDIVGLRTGLTGCTGLTQLTLEGCHDDLLPTLLTQLPRLHCLRLTDCSSLTRQAWENLRDLQSDSALLPDLHELQAENCTESSLTDEAVADLCTSPVARGLRRLQLSICHQLTAAALASIASGCRWLTHLNLTCFRRVCHDERIEAAFEHRIDLSLFWSSA